SGCVAIASTIKPWRFSISRWPRYASPDSAAFDSDTTWRPDQSSSRAFIRPRCPRKSCRPVALVVFPLKTLLTGPRFDQRATHRGHQSVRTLHRAAEKAPRDLPFRNPSTSASLAAVEILDRDIVRVSFRETEDDPILVVDPNAVEPRAVMLQVFEV